MVGVLRDIRRIADALEALVRIQRAMLTGKYVDQISAMYDNDEMEDDISEVLYHDDVEVAEAEAAEEKRRVVRDTRRGRAV